MPSVKAVEVVDLYFRSSNDLPVQRANVSKEEWEAVKEYIDLLEAKEIKLIQSMDRAVEICIEATIEAFVAGAFDEGCISNILEALEG